MRVLLYSEHPHAGEDPRGVGRRPRAVPSGAGALVDRLIGRGLAELGHRVYYLAPKSSGLPPAGAVAVSSSPPEVDVYHNLEHADRPWVRTHHRFDPFDEPPPDNWIFVSKSLARSYGKRRFVLNGLDPEEYLYSETKADYFLYLSSMGNRVHDPKYLRKGLDVALGLAREVGFPLRVAGTGSEQIIVDRVAELCRESGARYLGDVRGRAKAELIAGARALLFPTRLHEGCPLVVIEALMSGTPVIASDHGACPEVVTPEVGFVCSTVEAWAAAIGRIGGISSRACRDRALETHHYRVMAAGYVQEYVLELNAAG